MNQPSVQPQQVNPTEKVCDPTMRIVGSVGTALFIFGIFIPGAHTLMMVGMALIAISYVL